MGYIERELEKRRQQYQGGSDGESDTRSGIAANALQSNPTTNPASQTAAAPSPVPQALDPAAAQAQFYSLIGASPDGSLQYPQLNLPFDLDIANQRAGEVANYQQQNQQAIQALQQAAQQRLLGTRAIDEAQPGLERGNLNQFAGRGMAFSSGYGTSVSDLARELFNKRAGVESDYQQNQQNIVNQGLNNRNAFVQMLNQLASTQAERAAAKAAELSLSAPSAVNVPNPYAAAPAPAPAATPAKAATPTRAEFLRDHPILASLHGADRERFLRNHPGIAQAWARYN
jgi:hypothetical protein